MQPQVNENKKVPISNRNSMWVASISMILIGLVIVTIVGYLVFNQQYSTMCSQDNNALVLEQCGTSTSLGVGLLFVAFIMGIGFIIVPVTNLLS